MWKLSPEGLNNLVQGQNVFWLQMLRSFHSPICKSSTVARVPVGQACQRANQQPGPSLLPQIKAQAVRSPPSLTAPLLLFDGPHLFGTAAGLTTGPAGSRRQPARAPLLQARFSFPLAPTFTRHISSSLRPTPTQHPCSTVKMTVQDLLTLCSAGLRWICFGFFCGGKVNIHKPPITL